MTLENLLAIRQLLEHTAEPAALRKLLDAARRNLTDARFEQISSHSRFDAGYKCVMQCATIGLWASGYRTSTSQPGHHQTAIQCLIHTKQQLAAWFDAVPEPDTDEGDAFEVLLILVANYENTHFPIEAPHPIEAIKFRMAQEGLEAKDLVDVIGQKNRVYEVLTGKRKLSLEMIRRIRARMNISADVLIGH